MQLGIIDRFHSGSKLHDGDDDDDDDADTDDQTKLHDWLTVMVKLTGNVGIQLISVFLAENERESHLIDFLEFNLVRLDRFLELSSVSSLVAWESALTHLVGGAGVLKQITKLRVFVYGIASRGHLYIK